MPLPSPFFLRNSQNTPLTHSELDGNLSILSTKIDNTTGENLGNGVGLFQSKTASANEGKLNFYSLSGTNGISIGVSGDTLVIDGSGGSDTDWITNGNNIYNGNTGNVGIGIDSPIVKLHISGGTYNEGRLTVTDSISLPDNSKLVVGTTSDLQIYHDGLNSYIGEVGTGNLLISGREIWLSDGVTGNPYLRTNSPQSELSLFWSSETRIQTTEDGVKIHGTSSGTSVASLALRADGTIITGNTVPLGQSIDVNASADPNVFGYNTVNYTATSPGGTIYIGDSSLLPIGFQVKLIRTASTTSADIGAGGGSTINGSGTKTLPTALYSVVTCTANTNVWYCSTGTVL